MANGKPPAPSRGKGPAKGAPAPKGLGAKLNKEVHVGPLSIPYWGIGAIAIGAWWLWFHVIQPYNAAQDAATTDSGMGGGNLGSGSGGGGGGGQTGAATPAHRHPGRKHKHTHRGGANQHHHNDNRPTVGGPQRPPGGGGLPLHKPGRGGRSPAGFKPGR